jgi:hypothetical protein
VGADASPSGAPSVWAALGWGLGFSVFGAVVIIFGVLWCLDYRHMTRRPYARDEKRWRIVPLVGKYYKDWYPYGMYRSVGVGYVLFGVLCVALGVWSFTQA